MIQVRQVPVVIPSCIFCCYIGVIELDLEEFMEAVVEDNDGSGDYSPFPSRIFALLYILVHAIHPIASPYVYCATSSVLLVALLLQGERNLKFILFIMKQLDPALPSLDTIKRFQLPGFQPPTKVFKLLHGSESIHLCFTVSHVHFLNFCLAWYVQCMFLKNMLK